MPSTLLAINTVLFLSFASFTGTSAPPSNSGCLNDVGSSPQPLHPNQNGKSKRSDILESETNKSNSKENNSSVISFADSDVDENLEVDHHQIYKRNLNRDFPLKGKTNKRKPRTVQMHSTTKLNDAGFFIDDAMNIQKDNQKNIMRDFLDKIVLNDKFSLDGLSLMGKYHRDGLRAPNDTTKNLSKESYNYGENELCFNEGHDDSFNEGNIINNYCDSDIDYINKPNSDVSAIEVFSFNNSLSEKNGAQSTFKREALESRNSSFDTTAIKEEIDKVYKDISENVRLLSKLRDRESHLLRKPSKKRWVIIDNTADNSSRKRRCTQELTVEMDTNRDATPDRLEHIERKVEEEILQVNVPLRCNH